MIYTWIQKGGLEEEFCKENLKGIESEIKRKNREAAQRRRDRKKKQKEEEEEVSAKAGQGVEGPILTSQSQTENGTTTNKRPQTIEKEKRGSTSNRRGGSTTVTARGGRGRGRGGLGGRGGRGGATVGPLRGSQGMLPFSLHFHHRVVTFCV